MNASAQLGPQLLNPQGPRSRVVKPATVARNAPEPSYDWGRSGGGVHPTSGLWGFFDTVPEPNPTMVIARSFNVENVPFFSPLMTGGAGNGPVETQGTNIKRTLAIRVGKYSPPGVQ